MYHFNSKVLAGLSILALLTLSACATPLKSSVDTAEHAVIGGFETYALTASGARVLLSNEGSSDTGRFTNGNVSGLRNLARIKVHSQ